MVNIHAYEGELPPTEWIVVSKIESGLNNALRDLNLNLRKEDNIKRQKYIYAAIDYFVGLDTSPITYSWYRWGASQLAVPSSQDQPQRLFTESAGAQELLDISYTEYEEFFKNDVNGIPLSEWWNTEDPLVFLEQFYSEYTPPKSEYQDVYLANIALLSELNRLLPDLDNTQNLVSRETYDSLCSKTTDLEDAILVADSLSHTYEYISETTDLIEDVVMVLAKDDSQVIKQGHATAFGELRSFYQDHTWMIVANQISKDTAAGPHRDLIVNSSSKNYNDLVEKFYEEYWSIEDICDAMHLLPDVSDYEKFEHGSDEFDEKVTELMEVVDGRTDSE
jgi:hypothetical protein